MKQQGRLTAIRALVVVTTALVVGLFTTGTATAAPTEIAPAQTTITVPITGTAADGSTFTGQLAPQQFVAQGNALSVVGTLTGTVTRAGAPVGAVNQQATFPITIAQASCEILDLVLGPLDLNLLGLEIHLNQVHLVIEAQTGPGNLLGNLLCAIAGILDPPSPPLLAVIAQILNAILDLLG